MGLYDITQKYLNKEQISLREMQQELRNLPQGTLQRKNKKAINKQYERRNNKESSHVKNAYEKQCVGCSGERHL